MQIAQRWARRGQSAGSGRLLILCGIVPAVILAAEAQAHPWHRHRAAGEQTPMAEQSAAGLANEAAVVAPAAEHPFRFVAAPKPQAGVAIDIADAFAPFEKLKTISCRSDARWLYVESNGIPDHSLMVGIRSWQQQVPLPQKYVGDNAWQIPLNPVPAADPATTKNRFLRGAIALAVNGIPIFNPLNNRGEDALLAGELDEYGGHCGRADDYHYHLPPVHLEKQVGAGKPIAYALDGYAIYGFTEPDGSPVKNLDRLGGHEDAQGNYHYHATKQYPYLNGGFYGKVTERDGQVDPQPRAEGLREALPPLRGAKIVGFDAPRPDTRRLTYEIDGRRGTVEYSVAADGTANFSFTDPAGRATQTTYTPRRRGPGGGRRPEPGGPPPDRRPPPGGERRPPPQSASAAPAAQSVAEGALKVTSPAFGPNENLPAEFTCDGAGISPPVAWSPGPPGTKCYCLSLWHQAPDQLKSYWVVHGIPATVTELEKNSRGVGTVGLNDKRRAQYDPMCSRGPGAKTYHITVYALAALPKLPAAGATREALLEAIREITLDQGTLTYTYERSGR